MQASAVQKKIRQLETQLNALKRLFIQQKPDSKVDSKKWQSIRKDVKKSRKATYNRMYGKS